LAQKAPSATLYGEETPQNGRLKEERSMSKCRGVWITGAVVAMAAAYVGAHATVNAPLTRSGDQWENGEIRHFSLPERATADNIHIPAETKISWVTTEKALVATSWEEMVSKLKDPASEKVDSAG